MKIGTAWLKRLLQHIFGSKIVFCEAVITALDEKKREPVFSKHPLGLDRAAKVNEQLNAAHPLVAPLAMGTGLGKKGGLRWPVLGCGGRHADIFGLEAWLSIQKSYLGGLSRSCWGLDFRGGGGRWVWYQG